MSVARDSGPDRPGAPGREAPPRRPYSPPRLQIFGDVRSLTMGGSPGIGDSGSGSFTQQPAV